MIEREGESICSLRKYAQIHAYKSPVLQSHAPADREEEEEGEEEEKEGGKKSEGKGMTDLVMVLHYPPLSSADA